MEGMKAIPYIALLIAIAGIIIGAAAISLSKFGDTVEKCNTPTGVNSEGVSYNATVDNCMNGTQAFVGNKSTQFDSIKKASEAETDLAEQLPTVAIIGVMVIIISIVAGVFVYLRYFS